MISPLSATVMQNYRTALDISASPAFLDTDTPITPVAIIGGSISLSAGLPKPDSTQTPIVASVDVTTNTTTALYTVAAGKTAYISKIIAAPSSNAAAGANFTIQINGGASQGKGYVYQGAGANQYAEFEVFDYAFCLKLTAGQTLQIVTTNIAGTVTFTTMGYVV